MMRRFHKTTRRGFTLVELLVTMVLASIVMIAAFMLAQAISSVFYVQDQAVDSQGNLRFAMEFLGRDVSRAGFLASPSAGRDPVICPKPTVGVALNDLVGIRVDDGGSAASVFDPGSANNDNIAPDTLFLMGSFDSSVAFPLVNVQVGSPLTFDVDQLAALMGEGDQEARFLALFQPGRMLMVSHAQNFNQLVAITGRSWNSGDATVTVTGLRQRSGNVGCGIEGVAGEGYSASVVNLIRYSVEPDPNDASKMDLVRTELNVNNGTPLQLGGDAYAVPVLEYVTDFQVWLDTDTQNFRGSTVTPDTTYGDFNGNTSLSTISAARTWHTARVAHFALSARTIREDPSQPHTPRASATAPLLTFNLDEDGAGSARVITMTSSAELTNLTVRNIK